MEKILLSLPSVSLVAGEMGRKVCNSRGRSVPSYSAGRGSLKGGLDPS